MDYLHKLSRYCYRPALGLLLMRVVAGLIFANHGLMKLQNIDGATPFFASLGLSVSMLYLVALVEFIGGLMLVFGIIGRGAALALGIVGLFAALLVGIPKGGLSGAEFELLLAAVGFGFALHGVGSYRLMHLFELDRSSQSQS